MKRTLKQHATAVEKASNDIISSIDNLDSNGYIKDNQKSTQQLDKNITKACAENNVKESLIRSILFT